MQEKDFLKILKNYKSLENKPVSEDVGKPSDFDFTKEQYVRLAIQILKRGTEVLKTEGYQLTKI